jgi:NADH-quinone oxidoreductase subunit N
MNSLIALTTFGILAMFAGVIKQEKFLLPLTLIGLAITAFLNSQDWNGNVWSLNHMMLADNFAVSFFDITILIAAFIFFFYKNFYFKNDPHFADVFALLLFSLTGCYVLFSFENLLMLFLGIEILSLSLYVLAGLRKRDPASNEAAMKYFLMGSFSTGFMLFGIALLYGITGSFDLSAIASFVSANATEISPLLLIGVLLILVSLLFKVAAAPFQFWTPDVYEGSPTLVTAYMATVGKIAAFAGFYRLFAHCFTPMISNWSTVLWSVIVITMFFGNIVAIQQKNLKRMLAYSSISHAGYMLIAILSMNNQSAGALLYYSLAYSLASVASFSVINFIQEKTGSDSIESVNGLYQRFPFAAIVLAVSMLSLSGIPITAGFFGKFYIFSSAIQSGYTSLIVLAVINSFISVYYYFSPVIAAFFKKENGTMNLQIRNSDYALLFLLAFFILLIGILPGLITGLI